MRSATKKPYFDPKYKSNCVSLLPGEFYTTEEDECIMTILGSCVAACIRDTKYQMGGMNHFLLASPKENTSTSPSARYGSFAMECLINDILKRGGRRENIEVKIFGGSDLFSSSIAVGRKNCEFVTNYLKTEGFRIREQDLGGNRPRRIYYWPRTGRVESLILNPTEQKSVVSSEKRYTQKVAVKEEKHGSIELF